MSKNFKRCSEEVSIRILSCFIYQHGFLIPTYWNRKTEKNLWWNIPWEHSSFQEVKKTSLSTLESLNFIRMFLFLEVRAKFSCINLSCNILESTTSKNSKQMWEQCWELAERNRLPQSHSFKTSFTLVNSCASWLNQTTLNASFRSKTLNLSALELWLRKILLLVTKKRLNRKYLLTKKLV